MNSKGEYILSTCGEVHLERCVKDLNDDFCPGVGFSVSAPIIEFRETILNKKLSNRIFKNKQENYEVISESDSNEEEQKERGEMSVAEIIAFEEKSAKLAEQIQCEKELLKKDQQLDPYLEKLMELKVQ